MKPIVPLKVRCLSPVKAIRKFCLTRCEEGVKRVRLCEDTECPLYPYRLGRQPNRAGIGGGKRPLCQKIRHSSGVVRTEKGKLVVESGSSGLSNPGASGKRIDRGHIDLKTKGQIIIKRLNKELVITLTEG